MLFLLLVLAPFGTGLLMNRFIEAKQRSVGMAYVSGFLIMLATFQLLAVPVVFLDAWGFTAIVKMYTVVITLTDGLGIISLVSSVI